MNKQDLLLLEDLESRVKWVLSQNNDLREVIKQLREDNEALKNDLSKKKEELASLSRKLDIVQLSIEENGNLKSNVSDLRSYLKGLSDAVAECIEILK